MLDDELGWVNDVIVSECMLRRHWNWFVFELHVKVRLKSLIIRFRSECAARVRLSIYVCICMYIYHLYVYHSHQMHSPVCALCITNINVPRFHVSICESFVERANRECIYVCVCMHVSYMCIEIYTLYGFRQLFMVLSSIFLLEKLGCAFWLCGCCVSVSARSIRKLVQPIDRDSFGSGEGYNNRLHRIVHKMALSKTENLFVYVLYVMFTGLFPYVLTSLLYNNESIHGYVSSRNRNQVSVRTYWFRPISYTRTVYILNNF